MRRSRSEAIYRIATSQDWNRAKIYVTEPRLTNSNDGPSHYIPSAIELKLGVDADQNRAMSLLAAYKISTQVTTIQSLIRTDVGRSC